MTTQSELDLQAKLADMERQLAELAAKVNPWYAGGGDRYIHSGYLQFDGVPFRWDPKGMQVESNGASRTAIYFVNRLVPNPSGETEYAKLDGSVDATSILTGLQAVHSGSTGGVFMGAASGTGSAELTIFVSGWSNQPRAKLYPLTTDIGKLELQDAVLSFAGLASDPGTLTDGLMWYNTTTDKLYARINAATVELGGGSSMPMPPVVSTMSWHCIGTELAANAASAAASAVWPVADTAIYIPLLVTEDITVKKLWWTNGATVSGNVNMALYTAAFAQVSGTETGSTAQSGTSVVQEVDIADTALTAGLYYIAIVMDNTTGTMVRTTSGTAAFARALGLAQEASVFDLPATATLADPASMYVPICGIATRTQVA